MRSELGVPEKLGSHGWGARAVGGARGPGSGDPDHSCLSSRTTRGPLGLSSDLGAEAFAVELLLLLIVDL